MKRKWRQKTALVLASAFAVAMLGGCGGESDGDSGEANASGGAEQDASSEAGPDSSEKAKPDTSGKPTDFTFLITTAITEGYYDDYDDNPVAQWWTDQEWDADGDGEGTTMTVDFWAPTPGAEGDYVNTLISTEEYPDVMAMIYASESANAMYEEGMVLDLTDYIDAYMPNYKAYMEAHPQFLYTNKVDGEDKYLQLYIFNEDYVETPWAGLMYRRDWLVTYGKNPQTGEAFTGEWVDGEWVDDVVFPSGETNPVYISDWEWMFEIFATAIQQQGMTDGYVLQIPYQGAHTTGDIVSGFNTGMIMNYDSDGKAVADLTSEGFRTYVECMAKWYANGWVDPAFAERSGDIFFMIDNASVYSGQVGLWYGLASQLLDGLVGDGTNPWTANAVVFAAATPINDVYGDASVQNAEPKLFYQDPLLSSSFVITDKAADKDLATLLTAIDYFYSEKGAAVFSFGFSNEMLAGFEGKPYYDFYMENGLENGAYTMDGDTIVLEPEIVQNGDVGAVASGKRMLGMSKILNVEMGYSETKKSNMREWTKYSSTSTILTDVTGQLSADDLRNYNVFLSDANTCIAQWVPAFISGKSEVTDDAQWNQYVDEVNALGPDAVIESLNAIIGTN